ncbi:putative hydro-lyase [Nocardia sp. CDC159]|uniref:Putative hydro-lyase NDR86_12440 n=1 Tax=Nocardia pulmonis TaxID=2951408 RepID=A0A9X2EA10_9NOCA|nr:MULTISPECIES: putative hydro-lyase [Nocardia]MCM6774283.1 putative hydro-lyase [Nocardia pulmonis]MCM6787170.1 putative hydro-lyase [Nocardia sp. CDC159]
MQDRTHARPAEVRLRFREGTWTRPTTGMCPGYVQANLVVLPAEAAAEFEDLCRANPGPLPLIERTAPGDPRPRTAAPGADLRTDLPRYRVYRHGRLVDEPTDVRDVWPEDAVAFLLGCSFTAEARLRAAGVRLRHQELGRNVAMFVTSRPCTPAGRFHGPVVVSMRPIHRDQVETARRVTAELPLAHGAPMHIGDPSALGIADLARPDFGAAIEPEPDEIPVFWACGVTPQAVIAASSPPLAITHAPGHMFLTDLPDDHTEL